MARTDLRVTVDADAAKLDREMQRAARSVERLEREIAKGNREADKFAEQLNQRTAKALEHVGRGMVAFGAAVGIGLGLAAKAAIDWESAWTGVLKTVDGTPEQLAAVEAGLRDLATTLPATHSEIAAVAEAAGQLGIATPDVVAFTRVMVNLGETTNLTAEEAATSIAQLMNVMQTAPEDVGRLGAALVELGNNGASTERDIILMAQRIAGAGQIIGLAEHEVLAIANALASVGIEAEAGGTAISTAMTKMASAVAEGGDAVAGFAEVAGMSAQEFATAFETNPAQAIQSFVGGLGRIDAAGGNVFATLDELGLGTIRTRDALLRLSGAGDLLTQSFDDGARAWAENTALIEEAEKRYDTAEAKIAIARNTLVDLAIDIGGVILPAVTGLAEGTAALARFFSDLPGPVKTLVTVLGGLIGVASLVGGGFLLLAPRLAAARAEMQLLAVTAPRVAGGLALVGTAAKVALPLLAVAGAFIAINEATKATGPSVADATAALLDLNRGLTTAAMDEMIAARDELADTPAWQRLLGHVSGLGLAGSDAAKASEAMAVGFESFDKSLSGMVQGGNADLAAQSVRRLFEEFGKTGETLKEFINRVLPGYAEALKDVDNQQQITAESVSPLDAALADLATRFGLTGEDAAKAAQEMLDAWSEASTSFVDILGAYDTALATKEEAERETAQATADATADQSDSWEDYVGDVTISVDEYLAELERQVAAQQAWQENMLILAGRVSAGTLDQLARLGPEGAPLVEELVNASDAELARFEELMGARAEAGGQNFADRLAEAEPILKQIAHEEGQEVADSIAAGMAANGTNVFGEAKRQGVNIDRGVGTNRTRKVPIDVPLPTGIRRADGVLNHLARNRTATIRVQMRGASRGFLAGTFVGDGHSGGMVTSSGIIPRFHDGASLTGLGRDEIPAILQTRERVLSRAQNEAFETLMNTLGQAVPVLPMGGSRGASPRSGSGVAVENVNIQAWTDRFSLKQVESELAMHGVS